MTNFRTSVEGLVKSRIRFLPVDPPLVAAAVALSQQLGLLTNDAVTVAVMQANGLNKIASHDADFDRIPGLLRYAPA